MLQSLVFIIGAPFVAAAAALLVPSRWASRIALAVPASIVLVGAPLWSRAAAGDVVVVHIRWIAPLGITADLRLDRLGAFFVLLVGAVGLGIVAYARSYLGTKVSGPFWAALLAFMGSMLGVVLADSLILFYVFWELTTITSALLIATDHHLAEARRGAIQAFLVTGGGGLVMLAGILLLGQQTGTYNLSELEARSGALLARPDHVVPLSLLLVGAFTKSAQFPFHFWLPDAMAAPAPVSAYLHSATMVKAGIFLIGRLFHIFHASPIWLPVLVTVGLVTFCVSGWRAARAWDLKQMLAHSTVAYLGVLTALYGLYARVGATGELLTIASHASYKSALFLLVGWLEKATGTRDLSLLRRERWLRRLPLGGALVAIGAIAMAGAPLLLGFISKEILLEAVLAAPEGVRVVAMVLVLTGSAFAVVYSLKLFVDTFLGSHEPDPARTSNHVSKRRLLVVPALLLVPQVVGGVAPGWVLGLLEPGSEWPSGPAFWHDAGPLLQISLATYAAGALGFFAWTRLAQCPAAPGRSLPEALAVGALALSSWSSRALQRGGHPRYSAVVLLVATLGIGAALSSGFDEARGALERWGPDAHLGWFPALLVCGATIMALVTERRVTKVLAVTVSGYGVALIYAVFRAPDLALTQLLVESISLILLLLAFRRLPSLRPDPRAPSRRLAHAAIAAAVGLAMGVLAWTAGIAEAPGTAGREQLKLSVPAAEGRNVVNVILVDFRAADTLGEIVVLATAALGVMALIRSGRAAAGGKARRCDP